MDELSIVIPTYNEEKAVLSTIEFLDKFMAGSDINYEIIVVNDGSTDSTGKLLADCKYRITLVEHLTNKGYGAAIKSGIKKCKYDIICITDADGTYPNKDIPRLFNALKDYDMVVGQRSFKNLPGKTKPAKWFLTRLASYVTKTNIPDINSGLRLFRKDVFNTFLPIIPDGFSLTTTLTLGMITGNYDIKFEPIEYYVRKGRSKIRPIRDTLRFMKLIFKIGLYIAPLKIFIPCSIFLFLLAIGWGLYSWLILGKLADASMIVIAMTSLQFAAFALIAELINHRLPNHYKKI